MMTSIVTAGIRRAILLRRLLHPEFEQANGNLRLLTQSWDSTAEPLARTLLVTDSQPVALAVDAETVSPSRVRQERRDYEDLLSIAPKELRGIFLGVPEWLSLLFADRTILESLVGGPVTEVQLVRGHYEPKVVLAELLKERGVSDEEFDRRLAEADLTPLRQLSPVRELIDFVAKNALAPAA
jgi:hypothetical protein